MIHTAIGISDDIDPELALEQVLAMCDAELTGRSPQAGILFSSCMDWDFSSLLPRIVQHFPGLQLIGCTTDGEITHRTGFIEDALALLLFASETVEFKTGLAENLSTKGTETMAAAVSSCKKQMKTSPVCALVMPDGLSTIATPLDQLLQQAFGQNFPVFGGSAGDHFQIKETKQFFGDQVYSDACPFLLLGGQLKYSVAVRKGPVPTGLSYRVDHHEGNVVHQIDGQTALDFYRQHLGDYSEQVGQFPLAVYEDGQDDFYLRDPFQPNKETGAITFIGNFPETCTVRLTMVGREDVLSAVHCANQEVLAEYRPEGPDILLIFSCTSQRHVLGTKTDQMFEKLRDNGRRLTFFGFYCYGEIAPQQAGQPTLFHNDTYVVLALSGGV